MGVVGPLFKGQWKGFVEGMEGVNSAAANQAQHHKELGRGGGSQRTIQGQSLKKRNMVSSSSGTWECKVPAAETLASSQNIPVKIVEGGIL